MNKNRIKKAFDDMNPEIIDAAAKNWCEKCLEKETKTAKTINFKKRIALIAVAAALVIAAVMIPLAVMMNKAPDPATQPPVATKSEESKTEKQTTPTDVHQTTTPAPTTTPIVTPTPSDTTTPGNTLAKFPTVDLRGAEFTAIKSPPSIISSTGALGEPPEMEFPHDTDEFVVKMRYIETLPGTYLIPCWGHSWSIVKFQLVDQIYGSGLPEELYLTVWDKEIGAFAHYDAFYAAIKQICPDQTAVINDQTGETIIIGNLFQNAGRIDNGAIIALNGGKIDAALWSEPYWGNLSPVDDFLEYALGLEHGVNSTEEELREALTRKHREDDPGPEFITRATFADVEGAAELFDYIDRSGFFSAKVEKGKSLTFRRLINGYFTTEIIRFEGNTVTRTEAFTEEDLSCLPDLETMEKELFSDDDLPLHFHSDKKIVVKRAHIQSWYVKTEKGVFGVCKKVFDLGVIDYGDHISLATWHDDVYYHCDQSGLCWLDDRASLREAIGSGDFIETFEYNRSDPQC